VLFPVFVLGIENQSYLPFDHATIRRVYQASGFVLSAGAIGLGIARRFRETVYGGAFFFVAFLYLKYAQWWWDWMPKYLFFLIVALTAMALLWLLLRLRAALTIGRSEAAS
jgi:hypothetical protein